MKDNFLWGSPSHQKKHPGKVKFSRKSATDLTEEVNIFFYFLGKKVSSVSHRGVVIQVFFLLGEISGEDSVGALRQGCKVAVNAK